MNAPPHDLSMIAECTWAAVCPRGRVPSLVTTLKPAGRKSAVFRLAGAAPDGTSVIAKRAKRSSVDNEGRVYIELMPRLSVRTPHFYGIADDEDAEQRWLFIEDVGDAAWSPATRQHRQLASHWFGRAHLAAVNLLGVIELPMWGTDQYRDLVRSASQTLRATLDNPALRPAHRDLLRKFEADCLLLDSHWSVVRSLLGRTPTTLTLPGFAGKNARVRAGAAGSELVPFDFENACWGLPTIEIRDVEIGSYWRMVGEVWRIDRRQTRLLAILGRALYGLKSVPGEACTLSSPWPMRSVQKLACYGSDLGRAIQEFGLRAEL